ncbi:MAG: hypothetical protein H6962_05865 [Chromatiaceae bacterium]|nr:hypothetical protein [Chromatiaceae bacterium]
MIQLKNALQRDPGQLSAKILTGRTYLALGEPRLAEEEFAGQKLGADPLLVALPLARARNEIGKYDENIHDIVPIQFPHHCSPICGSNWASPAVQGRSGRRESRSARH